MNSFRFIDLFCGGGGSITGAINALHKAQIGYEGRGFNHWRTAIETIRANHPEVVPDIQRACAPIESVLPDEIFTEDPQRIDVVWASPSCTHHSNAAAGRPRSNQLRSQPEYLLPYLRLTKCRRMLIENVKELRSWGPLLDKDTSYKGKKYKAGSPDPRKEGLFFNLWYREIKASGYTVDMQVLNSADYGAATSRERLIIQAVRKSSGAKIVWPEPTHMEDPGIFAATYSPWKTAAEIINWSIPGESIFGRKKPLCQNTLRRIEAGIRKFWGNWAEPFIIMLHGGEGHISSSAVPLTKPLPTILTSGRHHALIRPFLTRYNGGEDRNHNITSPLPVIDCANRYSLISPIFIDQSHPGEQTDSSRCKSKQPLGTITTRNNWSCVVPSVEPFIVEYYSAQTKGSSIRNPINTITTKDRFGLIQGKMLTQEDNRKYHLDITHRMLTAQELARASSFPEGYVFCGGDTAAKKQIGNAVPPALAEALYRSILSA